jgi:hypothetical protein
LGRLQAIERSQCLHETVLHQIVDVFVTTEEAKRDSRDHMRVTAKERLARPGLPRPGRDDQDGVGGAGPRSRRGDGVSRGTLGTEPNHWHWMEVPPDLHDGS